MSTQSPDHDLSKWLSDVVGPAMLQIQNALMAIGQHFTEEIAPTLVLAMQAWQQLPDDLRPTIEHLAERGWFISGMMGLSEIRSLESVIKSGDAYQLDLCMQTWIKDELDAIRARACKRFPERAAIISSAVDAHLAGQFALSIPVLLIQVEGICVEVLGTKLFGMKKDVPVTKAAADQLIDNRLAEVFLIPLQKPSGLTASERSRSNFPESPNRHEILHGLDTKYPTRQNSFKAISLMEYFVTMVIPRASNSSST